MASVLSVRSLTPVFLRCASSSIFLLVAVMFLAGIIRCFNNPSNKEIPIFPHPIIDTLLFFIANFLNTIVNKIYIHQIFTL